MPTLNIGADLDLDLVPCVCGHPRDEHLNAVFAQCDTGCGCEDYLADEHMLIELVQMSGTAWASTTLDLEDAEALIGETATAWAGRCYEIATRLHRAATDAGVLTDARVVYGHYRGPIAPGSHFAARAGIGWVQHGWIDLGDGTVLDPTRWAFDGADPYLYEGPGDEYDEGGDILRATTTKSCPSEPGTVRTLTMTRPAAEWVAAASGGAINHLGDGTISATSAQLFWLANLSRHELGDHAKAVYTALDAGGCRGLIPLDNRRAILGD